MFRLLLSTNQQYSNIYKSQTKMRNMKIKQPNYLKQYTCYQYFDTLNQVYPVQQSLRIQFKGIASAIRNEPRYQIIDRLDLQGIQKMYICRWKMETGNTILEFFQFRSNHIWKIQMNQHPTFVNIVGDCIYLVGGNELYVVRLAGLTVQNVYALSSDTIHAVEAGFKQDDATVKGVYVYAFNSKQGFKKNFYSSNVSVLDNRWWHYLTNVLLLKKPSKQIMNSILKVVISNVLGVLIMPISDQNQREKYSQICLVNLSKMELIENCTFRLSNWALTHTSKAIVKINANRNSKGFHDSLLISFGEKDKQMIEIFVFHIKYLQQVAQKVIKDESQGPSNNIGLFSFASGDAVNWNESVIQPFLSFSTQGNLIDYLLTEKGVIFYANTPSRIPVSRFISYDSPLKLNPILALQHCLYSSYLQDNNTLSKFQQIQNKIRQLNQQIKRERQKQNSDPNSNFNSKQMEKQKQIQYDKLMEIQFLRQIQFNHQNNLFNSQLRPNRYSLHFLYAAIGVSPMNQINFSMINPKQLLIKWHKSYRPRRLINFQGDILVLRQNSITTFLPIQKQQYYSEYTSQSVLFQSYQMFADKQSASLGGSYKLSVNQSEYSDGKIIQPLTVNSSEQCIKQVKNIDNLPFSFDKEGSINMMKGREDEYYNDQNIKKYEQNLGYFIRKICNRTEQVNRQLYQDQDIGLKSQIFVRQLTVNRVKDLIGFYQRLLKYYFSKTINTHYVENFQSKMQKKLLNYLIFLNKLITEPYQQVNAHGLDVIEIFINQEIEKYRRVCQQKRNAMGEEEVVNVYLNVQNQSWKIIFTIFEQVVFESKPQYQNMNEIKVCPVNPFIGLLLRFIRSGFQYLQHNLSMTFNPYSSNNAFSQESTHFPYTTTLLNIYFFLPIKDNLKSQLLTSFLLKNFSSEADEKALNQMLYEVVAYKKQKQEVRNIYNQIISGKKAQNSLSSTGNQNLQKIDSSLGIIYLSKVFDSDKLEKYLLQINQQQLHSIFRINIDTILNKNNKLKQQKHKNQDILITWIFKFRVYVQKLKNFIHDLNQSHHQARIGSENNSMKSILQEYISICIHSLQNIIQYYAKINSNLKAIHLEQGINDNEYSYFNISDEEIIEKVCCRMVGYDSSHALYLYEKDHHKILPVQSFLNLIASILQDDQIYIQTVSNLQSISFYLLEKLLENPDKNIHMLHELSKYFSRAQLSSVITKNTSLRHLYEKLPKNKNGEEIRNYFGYNEINSLAFTGLNWRASILASDKNSAIKSDKLSSKKSQNAQVGEKNLAIEESKYDNLVFRNAYLEAMGS